MKVPIANRQLAIGNDLAVAEGFEPSITGLTIRCLTNLATPQKLNLAAATRLELVSSRLQDERSLIQLSYAAIWWTGRDSNPHKKFAGLLCSRLHHQPPAFVICHWTFFICHFIPCARCTN
jgi:hypothetical protein